MQPSSLNENAKKWIRALRSGIFQQGREYLNRDNHLCCLGVACELAAIEGIPVSKGIGSDGIFIYSVKGDSSEGILPNPVKEWLGLQTREGIFDEEVEIKPDDDDWGIVVNSLTELNDKGWTFDQIADFVESNPDGLFSN